MELFWKAVAAALLCAVLGLAVGRQEKDFTLVLSAAACCMAAAVGLTYLRPVLELLGELEELTGLDGDIFSALLKAVGIGLVSQLAGTLCQDAGNGSLAKTVELLGTAAVLYISLPVFQRVLALIREILEGL